MSVPEAVSGIGVKFAPPDRGWIDCIISAGAREFAFSLGYIYDPFRSDFREWLEEIVLVRAGRLEIDAERTILILEARPFGSDDRTCFTVCEKYAPPDSCLSAAMPRRILVSDFYRQLIAYWTSPALVDNWFDWHWDYSDPDAREDCPEDQSRPWLIRSAIVERYLAEGSKQ